MSQEFKLKFDQMRGNEIGKSDSKDNLYASPSHVRKLRFILPTGETISLNYAFLIKHEYKPDDGTITLYYTTDTITLKGTGLSSLDEELFFDIPKKIEAVDTRYQAIAGRPTSVTEITITSNT